MRSQHPEYMNSTDFSKAYVPESVKSSISNDLSIFGEVVLSPKILRWAADAESHPPEVHTQNSWGHKTNDLVTSEGWRRLQDFGISEGIVAIPFENEHGKHSRVYQFLKYHLWTGSCAYVTCPSAMSDGAAALFSRQLASEKPLPEREIFQFAYSRLTSRDPQLAWTSGQWMTEIKGGSDVEGTETEAACVTSSDASDTDLSTGPWSIAGSKWFASAIDANMAIVLAKMPEKGLSTFYIPTKKANASAQDPGVEESNGIEILRLKSKLGTRALPTAEINLRDARAWLIGAPGNGIREISTILNITRIHNAVTACGLWGRGLAIVRAFSRVRRIKQVPLTEVPSFIHTVAEQTVEYRGCMQLTFFVVSLLGVCEQKESRRKSPDANQFEAHTVVPSEPAASYLLRVLTPVAKALSAKAAIGGLSECMECLGGFGYLDSSSPSDIRTNIARLYRDASVLSIWEGTTNIMADDTIRTLCGRTGGAVLSALDEWIHQRFAEWRTDTYFCRAGGSQSLWLHWLSLASDVQCLQEVQLRLHGRDLMRRLGWIVSGVLLIEDARRDRCPEALLVAKKWNSRLQPRVGLDEPWQSQVAADRRIALGRHETSHAEPQGFRTKL